MDLAPCPANSCRKSPRHPASLPPYTAVRRVCRGVLIALPFCAKTSAVSGSLISPSFAEDDRNQSFLFWPRCPSFSPV